MNLESQVCSLDLAKRLKELGVKQDSLFYWEWTSDICYGVKFIPHCTYPLNNITYTHFSAFTVGELLDLLPHYIVTKDNEPYNSFRLRMEKGIWFSESYSFTFKPFYKVNYYCDVTSQELDLLFIPLTKNMSDSNPANALAMMLIYLLENGLIK